MKNGNGSCWDGEYWGREAFGDGALGWILADSAIRNRATLTKQANNKLEGGETQSTEKRIRILNVTRTTKHDAMTPSKPARGFTHATEKENNKIICCTQRARSERGGHKRGIRN